MDSKLVKSVILLCGPPASGKDKLTEALIILDNKFWHFQKHRGIEGEIPNNQASKQYINVSKDEFIKMIEQNQFIQYHERYNRYYGISQVLLNDKVNNGFIPIIHTGRIENLKELDRKVNGNTIKVLIWVPIEVLKQRLMKRHNHDSEEVERRLHAAEEEFSDLSKVDLRKTFDIILENSHPIKDSAYKLNQYLRDNNLFDREVEMLESYIKRFV